jgi:hypothetical protein
MFLAFDGRVIVDDYFHETGVYEVTDPKEAWVAVAIGADMWGVPELRRLLPDRPAGATDCPHCKGSGWFRWPAADGRPASLVCWECGAVGWLAPSAAEPGAAAVVRFAAGDAWLLGLIPDAGCDLEALLSAYVFVARDAVPPYGRVRGCLARGVRAGVVLPPAGGRLALDSAWGERFRQIAAAHSASEYGLMDLDEFLAASDRPAVGPAFVLDEAEYRRAAERVDRHQAVMFGRRAPL